MSPSLHPETRWELKGATAAIHSHCSQAGRPEFNPSRSWSWISSLLSHHKLAAYRTEGKYVKLILSLFSFSKFSYSLKSGPCWLWWQCIFKSITFNILIGGYGYLVVHLNGVCNCYDTSIIFLKTDMLCLRCLIFDDHINLKMPQMNQFMQRVVLLHLNA